jgi:fucose 4-O-acetylase-like acetyltransferase
MMAEQGERVGWIDAAHGLGIVAVVAGHTVQNPALHHLLYAFHMPLFFILSGFVYRDPRSMGELAQKRFFSLVVPYCAFLVLVSALDIALGAVTGQNWLTATPRSVIFLAFGGSVLHGSLTAFWFVPCLFFTNLIYAALSRRIGEPSTAWMAVFALVSYVVACLLSFAHRDLGQPSQTPLGTG